MWCVLPRKGYAFCTKAAAARRQRQNRWHNDEGSGSAMTKAEPAARQGREQQRDDEGRTGGATMKGVVAQR